MSSRTRHGLVSALTVLFAVMLIAGAGLTATRAAAVMQEVAETGSPGMLALRAGPAAPHWTGVRPGDTVHWPIEASLSDAPIGSLSVELRAQGDLVATGLTAAVVACTAPFVDAARSGAAPSCESSAVTVLAETPLADLASASSDRFALADLERGHPRHLLVTLRLPAAADPTAVAGAAATVGVGLHAAGDSPTPAMPPSALPDRLPVTGMDASAIGLLGAGLLGFGACLVARRRMRGDA